MKSRERLLYASDYVEFCATICAANNCEADTRIYVAGNRDNANFYAMTCSIMSNVDKKIGSKKIYIRF